MDCGSARGLITAECSCAKVDHGKEKEAESCVCLCNHGVLSFTRSKNGEDPPSCPGICGDAGSDEHVTQHFFTMSGEKTFFRMFVKRKHVLLRALKKKETVAKTRPPHLFPTANKVLLLSMVQATRKTAGKIAVFMQDCTGDQED